MAMRKAKRGNRTLQRFRFHALPLYPFCQWCQCPLTQETATTDHLVPRSKGGTDAWENLCLACQECNQKRRNDLPQKDPCGPRWHQDIVLHLTPPPSNSSVWVAWTRYTTGRWRRTVRGSDPDLCRASVHKIFRNSVELVILPEGEEPIPARDARPANRF